jgi:hypothetical protein
MEGAMFETTRSAFEQRPRPPRKIRLDCELYCPHSVRASSGDADCDHDFNTTPTVAQADFAVWNCTRCGRAFKFEIWKSGASAASGRSMRSVQDGKRPLPR